jgi:GT2 family glycosyltransferase
MVSHAIQPGIGVVGAMLYYPNDTIQHAGVILGIGGVAGHAHCRQPRGYYGVASRAALCQNLSAVTAACLVVRREVFEKVGGLDETDLAIAFNDIDFCLRVRENGYRNVWTPYAEFYHDESASRGYEESPEKLDRFEKERDHMKRRWGELLLNDPAYNPNLALDRETFMLAFPPRVSKPWRSSETRQAQVISTAISSI